MAEILKREYDIVVLKAELVDEGREHDIALFTLQYHEDTSDRLLIDGPSWKGPLSSIVPRSELRRRRSSADEPDFYLPTGMLADLADWFHSETQGNVSLWVHLVKPYGLLRYVPWERLIGKTLNIPVLMLPDFIFPPPREALAVLDVVLCGSAPLHYERHTVLQGLMQAIERIVESGDRRVHLHVFCDSELRDAIVNSAPAWLLNDKNVTIYDPAKAAPYVEESLSSRLVDQSGAIRSPWLLWIRDVMAKRSVDVVHFVCHGYYNGRHGALLFAQSPIERTEQYLAGPVSAVELDTFLTQVGAWSSVFTSLPDNASEVGLRGLADEVAQMRPGPMMMHVASEDPSGYQLADGYRFLYSQNNVAPPASTTALFIYCQPYLAADRVGVSPHLDVEVPLEEGSRTGLLSDSSGLLGAFRNRAQVLAALHSVASSSPLGGFFEGDENAPAVVSSTERFAEKIQLRYQQLARDAVLPTDMGEREMRAVLGTVDKLKEAVATLESVENKAGEQGAAAV